MANVTFTVPNAFVPRMLAAFGHWEMVGGFPTNNWIPATNNEAMAQVKEWAVAKVKEYELEEAVRLADIAERSRAAADQW